MAAEPQNESLSCACAGLVDMPPEVLHHIITASDDDAGRTTAGLHLTCRALRDAVAGSRAVMRLRRFSRQAAPVMQRFTGMHSGYISSAAPSHAGSDPLCPTIA